MLKLMFSYRARIHTFLPWLGGSSDGNGTGKSCFGRHRLPPNRFFLGKTGKREKTRKNGSNRNKIGWGVLLIVFSVPIFSRENS